MTFTDTDDFRAELCKIAERWWLFVIVNGEAMLVAGSRDFRARDDPKDLMAWLFMRWGEFPITVSEEEDWLPEVDVVSGGWFAKLQDELWKKRQDELDRKNRKSLRDRDRKEYRAHVVFEVEDFIREIAEGKKPNAKAAKSLLSLVEGGGLYLPNEDLPDEDIDED